MTAPGTLPLPSSDCTYSRLTECDPSAARRASSEDVPVTGPRRAPGSMTRGTDAACVLPTGEAVAAKQLTAPNARSKNPHEMKFRIAAFSGAEHPGLEFVECAPEGSGAVPGGFEQARRRLVSFEKAESPGGERRKRARPHLRPHIHLAAQSDRSVAATAHARRGARTAEAHRPGAVVLGQHGIDRVQHHRSSDRPRGTQPERAIEPRQAAH